MTFSGWTLRQAVHAAQRANAEVLESEDVLRTIGELREAYARLSAAHRGYLLGGSPSMLEEREEAIVLAQAAVQRLEQLTRRHPQQEAHMRKLQELLRERTAMTRGLAARMAKPALPLPFTAQEIDRIQRGQRDFIATIRALEAEESGLLGRRQVLEFERQRQTSLVIIASFALFALMVLLASAGMVIETRRRQSAERRMTELVENLPVTAWQAKSTPEGHRRFVYVADSALRARGVAAHELLRDPDLVLGSVHPEDRDRVDAALATSQRTLEPLDCAYRLAPRAPGEKPRWIHAHARLRRLGDRSLLWTGYWSDITAQKEMEQALREATQQARRANRAKSAFLATMSHEIRTPMTAAMGLLELLELTRLDGEQRVTVTLIRESSQSLLRIIDDILDFSKVEEGRLALAPEPASLRESIRRACEVHGGVAGSRGLVLQQRVDPRLAEAHLFDPLRVGQILNNFIGNAVKFTQKGGIRVAVDMLEASAGAQRVRLSVIDTGIGVAPERIAQLFQPFRQASPQIASVYGGTGLGLAICRRLAELMGGTVEMHSAPGRGTRVTFEATFGLADRADVQEGAAPPSGQRVAAAFANRRAAPSAEAAEKEGTLVLVVDDHPTNRLVLSRLVAALGYGVVTAADGAAGLALWRTRRIGLILTDSNMPRMNGHELARSIRRLEAGVGASRVPILGCTANAATGEAARCAAAGMQGCLVKPVGLAMLLDQLQRWLPLPGTPAPLAETSTPGADTQDSKFDAGLVAMVSGGEREAERQILEDYLRANTHDLLDLRQAIETHDLAEAARLAHRIKGAAQTLGAIALLRACDELEENARVQEPAGTLRADLDEVLARSAELEQRLRSRIAGTHRG